MLAMKFAAWLLLAVASASREEEACVAQEPTVAKGSSALSRKEVLKTVMADESQEAQAMHPGTESPSLALETEEVVVAHGSNHTEITEAQATLLPDKDVNATRKGISALKRKLLILEKAKQHASKRWSGICHTICSSYSWNTCCRGYMRNHFCSACALCQGPAPADKSQKCEATPAPTPVPR
mmetsp:Transcript_13126/g.30801  ORF Transcript_13126/g.30801 Transcript_13126/m.30801 type:complete len:182 (+) Transcript_13126:69-614(+)